MSVVPTECFSIHVVDADASYLLFAFLVFGKFLLDPGQIERTYSGPCSRSLNLDVDQLRFEDMIPNKVEVFLDQYARILSSLSPRYLPRLRLFVKSNERKNEAERLKKARVRDWKAGFLSGVNYFFGLTTTISPDQRQLLCSS